MNVLKNSYSCSFNLDFYCIKEMFLLINVQSFRTRHLCRVLFFNPYFVQRGGSVIVDVGTEICEPRTPSQTVRHKESY